MLQSLSCKSESYDDLMREIPLLHLIISKQLIFTLDDLEDN